VHDATTTTHDIDLDYDFWNADEILSAILPEELLEGAPSGFSATGHIAHLNLNDEYLPYKHIIGQVILDKNKGVRTVVNKLNSIDAEFRFFKMELLAGEPDYVVEHFSMSPIVCSLSTSLRCTGTLDCTPNMIGSFSFSAQATSSQTCLPGSDLSRFRRRRKGVESWRTI